jgi:hypothetical protein
MADKLKYPVGTAIRYNGCCRDCKGKIGKIVGGGEHRCYISLPESICDKRYLPRGIPASWSDIEVLVKKDEQLVFEFYNE